VVGVRHQERQTPKSNSRPHTEIRLIWVISTVDGIIESNQNKIRSNENDPYEPHKFKVQPPMVLADLLIIIVPVEIMGLIT
jgi:hypothetical protein